MTAVADHGSPGPAPGAGGCAESGLALIRAGIEEIVRSCTSSEPTGRAALIDEIAELEVPGSRLDSATADDVNVEIQIVVPIEALIDPDSPLPAEIPGHGPVPAELITTLTGKKTWRRLLTRAGIVIGGDSRRRKFSGFLAELIRARDRYSCTESYCDAPIRETDHIRRSTDGGATSFDQGRGTCQFHNQLRELPEWTVERVPDGVLTTTPTGHSYLYAVPTAAGITEPG